MPIRLTCPDVRALSDYLLGQMPEAEARGLEEHVSACSACALKLNDMVDRDTLARPIPSQAALALETGGEVQALMGRLRDVPALSTTVDEPITERPGTVIGPYKLLEQIGEGGFGLVFMAEQQQPIRRKVALKILKPGMDTRQVIARFEAERQALALMDHPNIAKVLEGGETASGRPYFVMDLVKGVPITEYCDQNTLTTRERLELFVSVCQAVQHAHQKGIIHRDIKPSNVLVTVHDGAPLAKVIDFGVAKAMGQQLTDKTLFTGFAQMIGTPLYMSPEQAAVSNGDVDTRSDIYSLGVLLYELLTGMTPFDKERLHQAGYDEIRRIIREEEPPKPSTRISTLGQAATTLSTQRKSDPKRLSQLFRGELDWIVMKALEKDRNRRYETASAFAADVQRYLGDEPVHACPPRALYRLGKFARRNKTGLAVAGIILMFVLLLGGGVGWSVRDRAGRQAEVAQQTRECLSRARCWVANKELPLARQELAEAKGRLGYDRTRLSQLAQEVQAVEEELLAVDADLTRFQTFLASVEQAHEAEFLHSGLLAVSANSGGSRTGPQQERPDRDPARAVPFLLQALSSYGVLEDDDWGARLQRSLLESEQVARVRRTAYEELLWLADDLVQRRVGHRSRRKLSRQETVAEVLAYLRRAEAVTSPTSAFYQIRARCRKALGDEEAARHDEERARQMQGAIALDHYLLGVSAYDAGNKAEASQQFDKALRVEPAHYWSLFWLAHCFGDLGNQEHDFAVAVAAFTGCILKRPDHAPAYVGRAAAYAKAGRTAKAEPDLREALRLRPDYAAAHTDLGVVLEEQGKLAEAEGEYREALRLRPDYAAGHNNFGAALRARGKLAGAEAEFREALRLKPDFAEAHSNLGNALKDQGMPVEAEAECREALRLRPDFPETHINLGAVLLDERKLAEAEAAYREALRLRPDHPVAHHGVGLALCQQGNTHEGEAELREALRLWPDYPEAHTNLGNALGRQEKHAEAEAEFREALRLRPEYVPARKNLGDALKAQGKLVDAVAAYREALRLRPGYAEAHCNLGQVLQQQGRFAESLDALKRWHELAAKQPNWPHPSAEWVRQAERFVELDAKLLKLLKGHGHPASAAERLELAFFCQEHKKIYIAAVRWYAEAFAAEPRAASDPRAQHRYNAACAAALAGCGRGDAAPLDEKERARFRQRALEWLRGDLTAWRQILDQEPQKVHSAVQATLQHWQEDADFSGVRGDALTRLPEAERRPWQQLWADVRQTLSKASRQAVNDTKQK